MKSRLVLGSALLASLAASPVLADETAAPVAQVDQAAPRVGRFTIGVQAEILPVGTYRLEAASTPGHSEDDNATAFGISATVGYDVAPHLTIGLAPRLILGVKPDEADGDAWKELDLRARVAGHLDVARGTRLYGFLEPGYSILLPKDGERYAGLAVAFGVGTSVDLGRHLFVNAELGFQSAELQGVDVDLHMNYLHVGLGGGARF